MLLARVSFVPHHDHEEAELVAAAEAYLVSLLKNGQICGDYVKGWTDGVLSAYVYLSHRTAAHHKYLSGWGQRRLSEVQLQFGAEPEWELLDDDASAPVPTLNSASTLYLFSHSLTAASPVRHGDKGTSIPLHLIPIHGRLREEVFFWSRTYARHDGLWLDSGSSEFTAYAEMSDPNSGLSTTGRQLCRDIEQSVEKPVYYYLLTHFGPKFGDPPRCPVCGNDWFVTDSPFPSREPFHKFHFRCDECRVVSHRAVVDGEPEEKANADGAEVDGAKVDGAKVDGAKVDGAKVDGAESDGENELLPGESVTGDAEEKAEPSTLKNGTDELY